MKPNTRIWLLIVFLPALLISPQFRPKLPEASCQVQLLSPGKGHVQPQFQLPNGKHQSQWKFSWTACRDATAYHLYVIGPEAYNPAIDNANIRTNSYQYHSPEHYGIVTTQGWKWKVRALVNGRWGPWSEMGTFNVNPKGTASIRNTCVVQLRSPNNRARLFKTRGRNGKYHSRWTFTWQPCRNASYYQLYVIGPGAQNPIVNRSHIQGNSYTYQSSDYGVIRTEGWKWQVRPFVNGRWGKWSSPRYFSVGLR